MGDNLYICFDTCVLVDCAFARNSESSPGLLDSIFKKMDAAAAKLVMPEVVLAELGLASSKREADVKAAFKGILDKIDEVAGKSLLDKRNKNDIVRSVKNRRDAILDSADEALAKVRTLATDGEKAILLGFTDEDIHEAILISLSGKKPSSVKAGYGLVQGDCLIAACLKRFITEHPGDRIVFVSSNTSDFAAVDDKDGYRLHPDLCDYLPGLIYFSDPISMMIDILPDKTKAGKTKTAKLSDVYKGIISLPAADAAWISELAKTAWLNPKTAEMMRQMQEDSRLYRSAVVLADAMSKIEKPNCEPYMAPLLGPTDTMRRMIDRASYRFDSATFANGLGAGLGSTDGEEDPDDGATVDGEGESDSNCG